MSGSIRASVIVPTFSRRFEEIAATLESLLAQLPLDCEMIVVNQNDTADAELASFVLLDSVRLNLVRISEKGLPNARNVGVAHARGEIVIFCDDDVFALPGFIEAHLSCYKDASVGGVAGRVLAGVMAEAHGPGRTIRLGRAENETNRRDAEAQRVTEDASSAISKVLCVSASLRSKDVVEKSTVGRFRRWDADFCANFDSTLKCDVDSAFGCNMSFRKALLTEAGGFNKSFGGTAHLEESDLCLRMRKRGHRLVFEPAACLVHVKGEKGGCRSESTGRWVYWYGHNYLLLFLRHFNRSFLPVFFVERLARFVLFAAESCDLSLLLHGMKGLIDGAHTYCMERHSRNQNNLSAKSQAPNPKFQISSKFQAPNSEAPNA